MAANPASPLYLFLALSLLGLHATPAASANSNSLTSFGGGGHGIIGYGITLYHPTCASACRVLASAWPLVCTDSSAGGNSTGTNTTSPSAQCFAHNDAFLQTLAYCISTHCADVDTAVLEDWWLRRAPGRSDNGQPVPKEGYQAALGKVLVPPTAIVPGSQVLGVTSLVSEAGYITQFEAMSAMETMEERHSTFGLILLITSTVLPIAFSLFRLIPLPAAWVSAFYAHVIDPPAIGKQHVVPIFGLGIMPTRGQAVFLLYLLSINIIFSCVGYEPGRPNAWYNTTEWEITAYIANRVGVLAFVNLAVLVIYGTRNSVLLFLTNWSHDTFLLLHRWIAAICIVQACLHAAIELQLFTTGAAAQARGQGLALYDFLSTQPYWYWGIVATLSLVLIAVPFSVLWFRTRMFEVWLTIHVVLSALVLIGSFLHIYYRFSTQWGYQTWLYISFAAWAFDRLVARPMRLLRHGVRRAHIMVLDKDYVRVDIPNLDLAGGHAYLYFPTLTWRVWENHPFSAAATSRSGPAFLGHETDEGDDTSETMSVEAMPGTTIPEDDGKKAAVRFASPTGSPTTSREGTDHLQDKEEQISEKLSIKPAKEDSLDKEIDIDVASDKMSFRSAKTSSSEGGSEDEIEPRKVTLPLDDDKIEPAQKETGASRTPAAEPTDANSVHAKAADDGEMTASPGGTPSNGTSSPANPHRRSFPLLPKDGTSNGISPKLIDKPTSSEDTISSPPAKTETGPEKMTQEPTTTATTGPQATATSTPPKAKHTRKVSINAPPPRTTSPKRSSPVPPTPFPPRTPFPPGLATASTTFFIRTRTGLTRFLPPAGTTTLSGVPVLIESSYGTEAQVSLIPDSSTRPCATYPHLVCIAGGVGVAVALQVLNRAEGLLRRPLGQTKLFWGTRSEALVGAVEGLVRKRGSAMRFCPRKEENGAVRRCRWGRTEVQIAVGERLDLRRILEEELGGERKLAGTLVVVCGPPEMADEVRVHVTGLARGGAVVRFKEESFAW